MGTQYAVTLQVPVVDQFGRALPSIYAGSAVFEKRIDLHQTMFHSMNVTLGAQSSYSDVVGDSIRRYYDATHFWLNINPNLPGLNLLGQTNQQTVNDWLAGNGQALISPLDVPQNITIQIGGHVLLRGVVQRHVTCTLAGFLTIDWPDYAQPPLP
jgi:hypothetical protein